MTSPNDKETRQTEKRLRSLLEDIFATNELYNFDELVDSIQKAITVPLDILAYVRERSWFQPNRPYLTFNFLSFELAAGNASRFPSRTDLVEREKQCLAENYNVRASPLCHIAYKSHHSGNIDRTVNLLMRIIVAFYVNCGYQDHFRNQVASRFARDFFKNNPSGNADGVVKFIEEKIGLRVSLWQPRDEMHFMRGGNTTVEQLLKPFPQSGATPLDIFESDQFRKDLRVSVLKMSQTSGEVAPDRRQYVVQTFSANRVAGTHDGKWAHFKARQKAVAVFQPLSAERIVIDAVFHASHVIKTFLEAFDELRASSILATSNSRGFACETAIAETPVKTLTGFYETLANTLEPTLRDAATITQAGAISVWVREPFRDSLVQRAVTVLDDDLASYNQLPSVAVGDDSAKLIAKCFAVNQTISLSHPAWIESERQLLDSRAFDHPPEVSDRHTKLNKQDESRHTLLNSNGELNSAALAVPILRGRAIIGVLEVVSAEVGQLTIDTDLLEQLAEICGGTLRRLELANDRAWLARMSFVHACRHRVEGLIREIEGDGSEKVKQLVDLIRPIESLGGDAHNEGHLMSAGVSPALTRAEEAMTTRLSASTAKEWLKKAADAMSSIPTHDIAYECFADVIEVLVSNASHSNLDLESLRVSVRRGTGSSMRSASTVEVVYAPPTAWIDGQRMDQIGVSPIRSRSSVTYHYGLFLLSAQLRMLGGFVQPLEEESDIGGRKFGLAFQIPVQSP